MKSDINNIHSVNWIDGMKINKDHFIAFENAMVSKINSAEQKDVTATNFGLLPSYSDKESSINISISVDGQSTLEVTLNKCIAVTLGGCQINITKETGALLSQSGYILKSQYDISKDEKEWYVVLTINPFNRIPVGDADPEEDPVRHPNVLPEYKLDIVSDSEVSKQELGLYHITVAKVILVDGKPVVDENYIPPCRSIQSHPDLKFVYGEISLFLNQMEAYALHIIQKVHQKKQTNELASMVLALSEKVLYYLNTVISDFRLNDQYEPPIKMITKLVCLARVIKSNLDVFVGTGKEELINYLADWCDISQGTFENILVEMVELKYIHTDINLSLSKVTGFTKLMLSLFKKLHELEYIGKKSDSNIFVKEEVVENAEIKKRRSFLLD